MRCLVAGAGGYIGLPLCAELAKRGHEVCAFDTWWFGKYPGPQIDVVVGDIRTVGDDSLIGFDAVIDLAGLSNDPAADLDPELTEYINVKGGKWLADAAKRAGVRKYVYSSSAAVYGSSDVPNLDVNAACHPQTAYAVSKLRVEEHLHAIVDGEFKPVILRNGTVYGVSPRMRFDLVVNAMVRSAWKDGGITVGGNGMQWRPFIHIDDLVEIFANAAEWRGGYTLNVATENYQIAAVAGIVCGSFPASNLLWHHPPAETDRRSYHVRPLIGPRRRVIDGVRDVTTALNNRTIDPMEPTAWTVRWYQGMQLGQKAPLKS